MFQERSLLPTLTHIHNTAVFNENLTLGLILKNVQDVLLNDKFVVNVIVIITSKYIRVQ